MSGIAALVLAGSRGGAADPVAALAGVSHKALAPVAGVAMLDRVVAALAASPGVGRIHLSGAPEEAARALPGVAALLAAGRLGFLPATLSPSGSVAAALEALGTPLLVTTADHALLTPAMVAHVLRAVPPEADAAAALAPAALLRAAFPNSRRTFLRFRDGAWSGCNLFLFRSPRAAGAVRFWQRLEAERKRPLRMLWLVSPLLVLRHALGLLTLRGALDALGRRTGARLEVVEMPEAEAAVDVDSAADLALTEAILAARAG
ncbi:NTP transferase domain-containing protein [Roseomonas sp. BN140053]|uniref:NTP transferase domain-containing protein n=1 Tax=Roseomonas sp. BN140053 TaxID=3391898 RepID=UPI0039EC9832